MANKTVKVKSIINDLRSQGVSVSYRRRSDGGYLITAVGTTKFKGAKGNAYAREILGLSLTKQQLSQRATAFGNSPIQFDAEIRNQIRKTNKAYRESEEKTFNQGNKPAKTSIKSVKANIKRRGKQRALEELKNNELRALGYAYPIIVDTLVARIEDLNGGGEFNNAISLLKEKRHSFRDKYIFEIYQVLYAYANKQSMSIETCVKAVEVLISQS